MFDRFSMRDLDLFGCWRRSVRQFDSVRVFLVALVFFSEHLFQPRCLFFGNLLIHERGPVTDDELLPATVTPEGTHFLEPSSFLSALTLPYGHCLHLPNFSDSEIFQSCALRVHSSRTTSRAARGIDCAAGLAKPTQ